MNYVPVLISLAAFGLSLAAFLRAGADGREAARFALLDAMSKLQERRARAAEQFDRAIRTIPAALRVPEFEIAVRQTDEMRQMLQGAMKLAAEVQGIGLTRHLRALRRQLVTLDSDLIHSESVARMVSEACHQIADQTKGHTPAQLEAIAAIMRSASAPKRAQGSVAD